MSMWSRIENTLSDMRQRIKNLVLGRRYAAMYAASEYLASRVRITAGEQAELMKNKFGQYINPPRAKYPATPGAPVRRVSGALQQSIVARVTRNRDGDYIPGVAVPVRNSRGFAYGIWHEEKSGHAFVRPTIEKYRDAMDRIIMDRLRG